MQACPPTLMPGVREKLLARLGELRNELLVADEARQSERWLDSHEVSDLKDVAERRQWTDLISTQERRDLAEVSDIDAALQRLDADTYGSCLDCAEPIDPQRLRVQPAAPRCAACQTAFEHAAHPHSHLRA